MLDMVIKLENTIFWYSPIISIEKFDHNLKMYVSIYPTRFLLQTWWHNDNEAPKAQKKNNKNVKREQTVAKN